MPRLLFGEVFFSHSLNPSEIIALIKRERISVVAAVPRQLETLREKIEHDYASRGELERFRRRFESSEGKHFLRRWLIFRDVHRLFGWKFWAFVSGGATLDEETEEFLAAAGIRGRARLRDDRDGVARDGKPSVQGQTRLDRKGAPRAGTEVGRERRDTGARR